ncbi:hypothetical protein [Nostoc sp. 'Lobaria pulmonaria (5183) cyanobiont']|nr:hypothetical protein [Nostoc sp. 'Lobaria pulmonaria (5183) cyanobiont']
MQMRITDIRPSEDVPIFLEYLERKHSNLDFTGRWRHQRKDAQISDR